MDMKLFFDMFSISVKTNQIKNQFLLSTVELGYSELGYNEHSAITNNLANSCN